MREIKFKCWNPETERMFYNYTIDKISRIRQSDDSLINEKVCLIYDFEDLIWLQFAGLKDANGKEIWEGDVISVGVLVTTEQDEIIGKTPKEDYVLGVVEFHKGAFMAVMAGGEGEKAACEIEEDCIVLGNIYENPELI